MRLIKVTAWIDPDTLPDEWRDDKHPMGITEDVYTMVCQTGVTIGGYLTGFDFQVVSE